jgi:hypothetical protein
VSHFAARLPHEVGTSLKPVTSRLSGLTTRIKVDITAALRSTKGTPGDLLGLLGLATAVGVYWVLRYQGQWAESDSGLMAQAIRVVADSTKLAPDALGVYSNGYGYQAVSLAITAFTGLRIETLQQIVYPVVSAILVLPAWTLYRELTGSRKAATWATLLLLLVPEHLFAVLRASHERLDRVFLMTALWLLIRGLRFRGDPSRSAIHTVLVLLMIYALVATNVLFGMSFVAALVTALILSWIAQRGPVGVRAMAIQTTSLFRWVSAAAALIVVAFVLFLYAPFGATLRLMVEIPGKLLALIVSGGAGFDPYAYVQTGWVSPIAFLVLTSMNIVLLVTSALIWIGLAFRWLRGSRPATSGIWILWLLYSAFALQGAASIASDQTGSLSGNVQLRAFAVFATVAAPLVAVVLSRWRPRPVLRKATSLAIGLTIVLALAKASLEPALANTWLFYSQAEIQALRWADGQQPDATIWVGPDERVVAAYAMEVGDPTFTYRLLAYKPPVDVDAVLVSDLVRLQSVRLGIPVPPLGSKNLLYDNGEVQIYR